MRKNEYVALLHYLLFDNSLLIKELENEEKRGHLLQQFKEFFPSAIDYCRQVGNLEAAANLLWVAQSVEVFINTHLSIQESLVNEELIEQLFDTALSIPDAQKKALFFQAFFASAPWVSQADFNSSLTLLTTSETKKKLFAHCAFQPFFKAPSTKMISAPHDKMIFQMLTLCFNDSFPMRPKLEMRH